MDSNNLKNITQQQIDALDAAIRGALSAGVFLQNLKPSDRTRLARVGKKNEPFADRSIVLAKQAPGLLTRQYTQESIEGVKGSREALLALSSLLALLKRSVDDTALLFSAELYTTALSIYETAKRLGPGSGHEELVNQLRELKRRRSKKVPAPAPAPAPAQTTGAPAQG